MLFGQTSSMTFSNPKAEFVGEGGQKSSSSTTPSTVTVKPYKAQVTMRFNEEVLWADEDYQLGVLQQLSDKTGPALARALDLGIYHGVNPLSGTAFAPITKYVSQTTNSVEVVASDKPMANLDAAEALVAGIPTGLALDPTFAKKFRAQRDPNGRRIYPDFTLSGTASDLDGYRAVTSDTVSASQEASTATNIKAFVGDWSQIYWGVQRRIGVELIEFGDPDGQGDLKRNNQIALRAEVVYGWVIGDLTRFAKVVDAVAG
jgi:HK97 family phage major capsid protein